MKASRSRRGWNLTGSRQARLTPPPRRHTAELAVARARQTAVRLLHGLRSYIIMQPRAARPVTSSRSNKVNCPSTSLRGEIINRFCRAIPNVLDVKQKTTSKTRLRGLTFFAESVLDVCLGISPFRLLLHDPPLYEALALAIEAECGSSVEHYYQIFRVADSTFSM